MTHNNLVWSLCETEKIYWPGGNFTQPALDELFDFHRNMMETDGLFDQVSAEGALIYIARETDAFQEWDRNNGVMRNE